MSNQNILFYSPNCQESQFFIQKLAEIGTLDSSFLKINVQTHRHHVPPYVTHTPTIVVQNFNRPLVSRECFEWLNKMIQTSQSVATDDGNIQDFNPLELGSGFTDQYSYFQDDQSGGSSIFGNSGAGTFSYLDNQEHSLINAPTDTSRNNTKKDEFSQKMEEYQRMRDQDIPRGHIRI